MQIEVTLSDIVASLERCSDDWVLGDLLNLFRLMVETEASYGGLVVNMAYEARSIGFDARPTAKFLRKLADALDDEGPTP